MNRRYIAVTPCRNEEKNLPNLVQSITTQTLKPALWVIVDDGSTDRTGEIITEAEKRHDWIKGIHLKKNEEYMGTHIAYVCNTGFGFAEEYCAENKISYDYIALVDADNLLEARYFEKLINEFGNDKKMGIASGNSAFADIESILDDLRAKNPNVTVMDTEFWQIWYNTTTQTPNSREDLPMGSARLWRKDCFEETGGYQPVPLPDSVSNAMAKMKGWKTRRFMDIKVIERQSLGKQGLWEGYKEKGESYFFLGQSLFLAVLKTLKYSFNMPYYTGVAYFYGYIKPLILRKERVEDDDVRNYYKHIRSKELRTVHKEKLKKLLGRK